MSKLGIEQTIILGLALVCATVLVGMGKLSVESAQPVFSAIVTGVFALAIPGKTGDTK